MGTSTSSRLCFGLVRLPTVDLGWVEQRRCCSPHMQGIVSCWRCCCTVAQIQILPGTMTAMLHYMPQHIAATRTASRWTTRRTRGGASASSRHCRRIARSASDRVGSARRRRAPQQRLRLRTFSSRLAPGRPPRGATRRGVSLSTRLRGERSTGTAPWRALTLSLGSNAQRRAIYVSGATGAQTSSRRAASSAPLRAGAPPQSATSCARLRATIHRARTHSPQQQRRRLLRRRRCPRPRKATPCSSPGRRQRKPRRSKPQSSRGVPSARRRRLLALAAYSLVTLRCRAITR